MTNDVIRMGYVSTFDESSGMCSVIYHDRNAETATSKMPIFLPFGIRQKLNKDDAVIVVHLSNGSEVGIVIGAFAQQDGVPRTSINTSKTDITFSVLAGSITVAEMIRIRDTEIPNLWAAIGDD